MKLASFDIFDTTLIRRCGAPENIFYLMARRLYPDDEAMQREFVAWRKRCPGELQKEIKGREVMLEDVYGLDNAQCTMHNAQSISSSSLVELEKEIESENLMVNHAVKAVIDKYRAEGWTIAFVSDMYLDSQLLEEVLRREGCFVDGDLIYVSCECGARKDLGTMYDLIRRELKPAEWKHWGDNRHSDVKMARRKGVDAQWVDTTTYTEAESRSVLGGYQRAARIALSNSSFASVAADFVAPAYVPYILWLLKGQRSKVKGQKSIDNIPLTPTGSSPNLGEQFGAQCSEVRNLYFLSRDSYVLMKGAERLQKYYPNVEMHYLFLSRRSLLLPYLADDVTAERLLSVMDKQTIYGKRVDDLLAQLATDRAELEQLGIVFDYLKIRNKADEADFLTKIFEDDYLPLLAQRAKEAKELLVRYFEQEGLLSGDACDMVDVGWLGTSRLMVNRILDSMGAPRVRFLYYGVRGDVFSAECGQYDSYFEAGELTTMATALIENYFSASPYPTTIGYKMSEGRVVPIFKDDADFCDTEITRANREAVGLMIDWCFGLGCDDELLRQWAVEQLGRIADLSCRVDLSPFASANDFDSSSFVRKMTLGELFRFLFLGANITAFDKMSLCLTVGYRWTKLLWQIHGISGKIRRFLYLKLKHNK